MEQRAGYLIKRVQHALRLAMDAALQRLDLTTAQYAALSALEQTPNASNAVLARACFVAPQTMIEILRGLERSGFVIRQAHPEHGRIIQTVLTPRGRDRLATAHKVVGQIEGAMLSGLCEAERKTFVALLQRCCKNLEDE